MKIIINKKKLTPLIAIVLFILLGAFNISSGIAIHMQGDGATFNLDKADPVGYGVYIPAPNMYATMSITGSNQGEFVSMDWDGTPWQTETVDYPGNDISYAYPWYFENYPLISSTTDNGYINPWSVQWLNVSAYEAENDTLSPYTFNTAFNYYVMAEGSELIVPLNHSIPIQVDIMIHNTGPKILKFDWLTDNPAAVTSSYELISPSGKIVMTDFQTAQSMMGGVNVFDYIAFVANNIGTYRLLVEAAHNKPAYLNLEFLQTHISTLPLEKLTFEGNGDENPTLHEMYDIEWQSNWFKINGKKGDLFRLDLGIDYISIVPMIDAWLPCENGYILDSTITTGVYDLYFPNSGAAYISFNDAQYGQWYRYSVFLSEIEVSDYNIGDNITSIRVSRDQRKAIDFTIEQDSFVRFNFTEWGDGDAKISSMGTDRGFIFKDAKKLDCYEILSPIETKTVDTMDFYYYYFPVGEYEAIIKNTDYQCDGVLQISSNFVEWANDTIPVNSLTYPEVDASQYITLEFGPDEYYSSLKEAQWIGINITEPGQYILNTTIWATDNSGASATGGVSQLYTYNATDTSYYSFGYPQPAFSTDGSSTQNDLLFIGASTRWTGMLFNFSIPGSVGGFMTPWVYTTGGWSTMSHSDGTSELTQDGVIEFTLTDNDFRDWTRGAGSYAIDPSIDENDYYWSILQCTSDYSTVPIIELITLLNQTIRGDVNFALLRESGYEYCDTWGPTWLDQPIQPDGLRVSRDEDNDFFGTLEYDSDESFIIESSEPFTIGFEEGLYKLLIVPENWDFSGSIRIRFAVENYWPYKAHATYNISALTPYPNLHLFDINNYTATGYGHNNDTLYNYGLIKTYNHTEVSLGSVGFDRAYFLLEVYGKAYQWTQLVVAMQNVSNYDLFLLQDLPWVDNYGPNYEVINPISGDWDNVAVNKTYEFGVHVDHFFLLFKANDIFPNEIMTFRIALSQYNTTALYASEITATYTPPVPDLGPLILTLLIAIPSAIGVAVVVVYVVKKRSGSKQ